MKPIGYAPLDGAGFRRHLDQLDLSVRTLSGLIVDGIPNATTALVQGDRARYDSIVSDYQAVKDLPEQMERAVSVDIARRAPVGSDLRLLVTVLRVAPALGRCLELVNHIAARHWLGPLLPPDAAGAYQDMGRLAWSLWKEAGRSWCEVDPTAAVRLAEQDDDLDRAVSGLGAVLRRSDLSVVAAMQAVTVGRFYERLGAHAVDLAKRTRWYADGA